MNELRNSIVLICWILIMQGCSSPKTTDSQEVKNAIVQENELEGTSDWLINVLYKKCEYPDHQNCRRENIEGFCSHASIKAGDTLNIFVSTNPGMAYDLNIYRMGYYGGKGGRLMRSFQHLKGKKQATPVADAKTNFLECKWDTAVSLEIPHDWLSGVYLGKLTTLEDSSQAYIIFIVKDDRPVDFAFQCSDMTWQAYNRWPRWHSMYDEGQKPWVNTNGARISFDRPYSLYVNNLPSDFNPLSNGAGEFLLWEFPLAFWMEKQGYDVSYISNTDTHANPSLLLRSKAFLSVGHDEYWTPEMFSNVTSARDQGVNLMFFSGNSVDGTVYLEPSTSGTPNRVTGRLPQREFDNEQDLMGCSSYGVGYCALVCKQPDHWVYEGTGMKLNDSIPDLIGWEYHGLPTGNHKDLVILAQNKPPVNKFTNSDPPDHTSTIYTAPKGNFVFNAGTCWWSMPLAAPPGFKNPVYNLGSDGYRVLDFSKGDSRIERITKNLFDRVLSTDIDKSK
ncbi:MAG TPA: N,N-dimethylformamidase beta subunit family domain-containing protein [Chryseolinea sp.]|nr:N,N-dimethylformamidase beta subunit family domain-containing protein [Chryseolinea sp.]